jgi:hypothetical protein
VLHFSVGELAVMVGAEYLNLRKVFLRHFCREGVLGEGHRTGPRVSAASPIFLEKSQSQRKGTILRHLSRREPSPLLRQTG